MATILEHIALINFNSPISKISETELLQVAEEHPYFIIPHFLLAKKDDITVNHTDLVHHAAVYVNDIHRLHFLLNEKDETIDNAYQVDDEDEESIDELNEYLKSVEENEAKIETEVKKNYENQFFELKDEENSNIEAEEQIEAELLKLEQEEVNQPDLKAEKLIEAIPLDREQHIDNQPDIKAEEKKLAEVLIPEPQMVNQPEIEAVELLQAQPLDREQHIDNQPNIEAEEKLLAEVHLLEPQMVNQPEIEGKKPEIALQNKGEALNELFIPYHTVDYFASQGLKVEAILNNANDNLSNKLKSFTQWLKGMKRLETADNKVNDPVIDKKATESLKEDDVITESMVEVLVKQGHFYKAIETLEKLMLLHPEKNTLFAARIDELKKLL